jgi:hypothetical protein
MRATVEAMATRQEELLTSPARHALQLGIWSDKLKIDPEEVRRLAPLWGKNFEANG